MVQCVDAIYESGVLRPLQPLQLKESEVVQLEISPAGTAANEELIDDSILAYARKRVAEAGRIPSHEEVRRNFAVIKESRSELIFSERGEY